MGLAACFTTLAACGSCDKTEPGGTPSPATSASSTPVVVAEPLPRCRGEAQRLAVPGEDVIVGDVAIGPNGLLVGLIRGDGARRVASVMRASLDLATSKMIDIGPSMGDDPPPSPRWNGGAAIATFIARRPSDAGTKLRELRVARMDDALGKIETTIVQQADESTAFDVAWSEGGGAGLAAWDEDAPSKADAGNPEVAERGFVKVQPFTEGARPRVASPESSDAESPRLLPRPGGGFWLAWLARRAEEEAYSVEGAGEKRAFRWVEVVALNASGEPAGAVRRVSSEKGRAASFELARSGSDLVVMVQDEAAPSEGAGARIVRHLVTERLESSDVVDGGVGHAVAELVPVSSPSEGARWLAWTDTSERAHMTPLGAGLLAAGRPTSEPSLDGARVLAAVAPDGIYALVGAAPTSDGPGAAAGRPRPELRRFLCPPSGDKPK